MMPDTPRGTLSLVSDDRRQKAIDGSTSPYTKREVPPEELEKAENDLRNEARLLAKQIDSTYWDLGRCLFDVFDGLPGGYRDLMSGNGSKAARKSLFEKWGYTSFAEYCEKEVGLLKRSAENLRHAYWWFEIELILPRELKDQIRALGRSKVYQLAGFVTQDNIMSWIDKAKSMTHEDLKKAVKAAKAVTAGKPNDPEELDQHAGDGGRDDDDGPKTPPAIEQTHTVQTSLYDGQFETWQAALEQAKRLSGSDKTGHNLELICQDFLANNDFDKDSGDNKRAYIAKIERRLGAKIIAIDPSSGEPLYGAELLWMLVKEKARADSQSSDDSEDDNTGNF